MGDFRWLFDEGLEPTNSNAFHYAKMNVILNTAKFREGIVRKNMCWQSQATTSVSLYKGGSLRAIGRQRLQQTQQESNAKTEEICADFVCLALELAEINHSTNAGTRQSQSCVVNWFWSSSKSKSVNQVPFPMLLYQVWRVFGVRR